MSEYNRHKWAMEWMHGGGRDPNGRSLDDEIRIGKEDWMERQRVAQGGRIGLQSGQLVQPGPGRQPFAPDNRDRVAYRKKYYDTYEKRPRVPGSIEGGRTSPVDSINSQVRTYLRSLSNGAKVDTGKIMKRFDIHTSNMSAILGEPEFLKKGFNIIQSKVIEKYKIQTGSQRAATTFTPDEIKKIESLYSSKYNNLKGQKLIDALYADGHSKRLRTLVGKLRSGELKGGDKPSGERKRAIIEAYKKFKAKKKTLPHTSDIYNKILRTLPKQHIRNNVLMYIGEVLDASNLKYERGPALKHSDKLERQREIQRVRKAKLEKLSDPYVEKVTRGTKGLIIPKVEIGPFKFKGTVFGGVHKHHMNSLRQNVNLRNVAYIPGSDNWWLSQNIERTFSNIYNRREKLLKDKPQDWKKKFNALNKTGRDALKNLPKRLQGLINFEVAEVNPRGTVKSSNIGMDWRKSIGADVKGEIGKIDFKKLTTTQQEKIIALHKEKLKAYKANRFKAFMPGAGAAGTLGGLGIGLGTVAAGAEYQQGKPLYDVFANLPVEFASFGIIPATEISQQLRIRGDLKDKGLSLAERNKKMALYNRAQAQEAIERDVGDVGLESYALSGLGEGETKEQAYAVREDEDRELMERKIKRGYNLETGKWEDKDPIAFDEAMLAEGGSVPRTGYQTAGSVGKGVLRKALGWFGADIGFYYLEKWNEMSKGKSEEEAAAIALDNATLGVYKNKTYIEGLKKSAKEMGIDSRAFENVYKMNEKWAKVQKEHQRYQGMIEKLEGMEASPERDARLEQITNAYNNWQEGMDPEIRKWQQGIVDDISISKTGGIASPLELSKARESLTEEDWNKPFIDIQDAALEKLEKEKATAYDMQSKQLDPEAGNIGNWLNTNVFTLDARGKAKEQERINDMLDFDPRELYRYNRARGLDPDNPLTWEAYKTLKSAHPGLGFQGAEGGIADLLKK